MTKHLTALAVLILTLIYVTNRDFTITTTTDYAISVVVVILFAYVISRLLTKCKRDKK